MFFSFKNSLNNFPIIVFFSLKNSSSIYFFTTLATNVVLTSTQKSVITCFFLNSCYFFFYFIFQFSPALGLCVCSNQGIVTVWYSWTQKRYNILKWKREKEEWAKNYETKLLLSSMKYTQCFLLCVLLPSYSLSVYFSSSPFHLYVLIVLGVVRIVKKRENIVGFCLVSLTVPVLIVS